MPATLLLLLTAALAVAERPVDPGVELIYQRGADVTGCPDEPALRAAVSARIGFDPFVAR